MDILLYKVKGHASSVKNNTQAPTSQTIIIIIII